MKEVFLGPSRIATTQVGFGCAQICRLPWNRDRIAVLEAAYDAGVRHFDTARMYGLGAAESVVGRFVKGKRDQLTIATKFGIPLSATQHRMAAVQPLLRSLVRAAPRLRRTAQTHSVANNSVRDFSPESASQSLAESLWALGVDYLDILLLHEPRITDAWLNEASEWLETQRAKGVIREYGMSGYLDDVTAIGEQIRSLRRVTQFASDALNENVLAYETLPEEGVVTFSSVSGPLAAIDAETCGDMRRVVRYCVAKSAQMSPQGVTLVSTTRADRVSLLVSAACEAPGPVPAELLAVKAQQGG